MDNKKVDLRIVKTKLNIYAALESLMKEKPFEEIKVLDICSAALINRSTFYAHYNDKYELLAEYINSLKDNLTFELNKNNNISNTKEYYMEMIKLLLDHLEEKKETYLSIMINNKNSITMDIFYDVINKEIIKQIEGNEGIKNSRIPSNIISRFYLGAVINVCMECLKFPNKYSKEELIKYFELLIPNNLY